MTGHGCGVRPGPGAGSVRLVLGAAAADLRHDGVGRPDPACPRRADAAGASSRAEIGELLGLDEHVGERGVADRRRRASWSSGVGVIVSLTGGPGS